MEQLVERAGLDAPDRLFLGDDALGDHVDGDLERRRGGALAGAGLEHEELALLHRELDVLHVAVMRFEPAADLHEVGEDGGHDLFHRRKRRIVGLLAGDA